MLYCSFWANKILPQYHATTNSKLDVRPLQHNPKLLTTSNRNGKKANTNQTGMAIGAQPDISMAVATNALAQTLRHEVLIIT